MTGNASAKRKFQPPLWLIIAAVAAVLALILARSLIIAALVSVGQGIYAMLIGPSQVAYWILLVMAGMIAALLSFRAPDEAAAKRVSGSITSPVFEGRVAQLSRRLRVSSSRDTIRRDFARYLLSLISEAKGLPPTESHRLLQDRLERGDFALPPQAEQYLLESLREPEITEPRITLLDVPPLVWIRDWLPRRPMRYIPDPRLNVLIDYLESELDIPYVPHSD
jgi:hypothetical protein